MGASFLLLLLVVTATAVSSQFEKIHGRRKLRSPSLRRHGRDTEEEGVLTLQLPVRPQLGDFCGLRGNDKTIVSQGKRRLRDPLLPKTTREAIERDIRAANARANANIQCLGSNGNRYVYACSRKEWLVYQKGRLAKFNPNSVVRDATVQLSCPFKNIRTKMLRALNYATPTWERAGDIWRTLDAPLQAAIPSHDAANVDHVVPLSLVAGCIQDRGYGILLRGSDFTDIVTVMNRPENLAIIPTEFNTVLGSFWEGNLGFRWAGTKEDLRTAIEYYGERVGLYHLPVPHVRETLDKLGDINADLGDCVTSLFEEGVAALEEAALSVDSDVKGSE